MEREINLSDILNVEFFQKMQDAFSDAFGFAAIATDLTKNYTKPSNFTDFCMKCTRGSKEGLKRCLQCDLNGGKTAARSGHPAIYTCHAGLTDFSVPIMLGDIHIGSIQCGQVLTEKPNEDFFRKIARELNINENDYLEALHRVKIVNLDDLEKAMNALFLIANTLSELAYNNYKLMMKSKREQKLRNLLKSINSTFDMKKFSKVLCHDATKIFDVQRALLLKVTDEVIYPITIYETNEKDYDKSITYTMKQLDNTRDYWISEFKKGNDIIVYTCPEEFPSFAESFVRNSHIKSAVSVITKTDRNNDHYVLALEEYEKERVWTEDEICFLRVLGQQIIVAAKQNMLFEELKQQHEKEKAFLKNIPYIAWLKDKEGRYVTANEEYLKREHFKLSDIVGHTDFDLYEKSFAQERYEEDKQVLATKKMYKFEKFTKIGVVMRWVSVCKNPILDTEGNVTGVVGILKDITDEKEIDRLKSEFVSMVSHELRTPLTSIRGGLGAVLNGMVGEITPETKTMLSIADRNSKRLLSLINDILDVEKIEAGKMDFDIKSQEVSPIIESAVEEMEKFAEKYNVKIVYENNIKDAQVEIDVERFTQVLVNLMSNGIKYSPAEGELDVVSEFVGKKNNKIKISVTNYGDEIPLKKRDLVFGKFTQLDSSDNRKKGGTGLGLSISKKIMEQLNGTIDFESSPEKTSFYVLLFKTEK